MATATASKSPAPASAHARATKVDRVRFLEEWALEHPLETLEAARAAVREKYGISVGTKILSVAMRNAKTQWEAQRRAATQNQRAMTPPLPGVPTPTPVALPRTPALLAAPLSVPTAMPTAAPTALPRTPVAQLAQEMQLHGIRLMEILADGGLRVEFVTPGPVSG